jgi:hypothetical protein
MKNNKNKKSKIFCFDLDNVICITERNYYLKSKPIKESISIVNKLYEKGFVIKIFTSRFMGRAKEDVNKAISRGYKITEEQLKKWKVKYTYLIFGKPSFDVIIDDKSFNFKKNWHSSFKKKYLSFDDNVK